MDIFSNKVYIKPKGQLMKWVGNKYKFADQITSSFPSNIKTYYEPFLGTGAILATLSPDKAVASDNLSTLIELWNLIKYKPEKVSLYYKNVINELYNSPLSVYNKIKDSYNSNPNGLDLLIISRTCYGGVMRFTKEGKISTPLGPHRPISPETFDLRLFEWSSRVQNTEFIHSDYKNIMRKAGVDDLIYCDPPYSDSQSILYGSQNFNLNELFLEIQEAKNRGARVVLSIDGVKKSGNKSIIFTFPPSLFHSESLISRGFDMLLRFQRNGESMLGEEVKDRLLLTW